MSLHNGCYNRPPLRETVVVQDGYHNSPRDLYRNPRLREIPDPMTKDCQYSITYGNDPKCAGCQWNQYKETTK